MSMGDRSKDFEEIEKAAVAALARLGGEIARQRRGEGPATGFAPIAEVMEKLQVDKWLSEGGMQPDTFDDFLEDYLRYSVKFHHPGYISHQVSVPGFPGALAALINGFTNNPMAIYEMGAAASTLEFAVINWMLKKVGWPIQAMPGTAGAKHAGGVLTHGGSLGNLTSLLAARARAAPDAWRDGVPDDLAILVPPISHYSVDRAASIIGIGSAAVYKVPGDANGVIDPGQLDAALQQLRADGRRCMALVANACATATGLHDPLRAIGEFCNENAIWLHVDACHGATALLAENARQYVDGIELADSIVWDTHKMMQVPVLCAAVLLKDVADFGRAFQQDASYLAMDNDTERYSTLPRTVECTKAALSLKIFLTLAWWGEKRLGNYVDDRYAATRRFYELIRKRAGFECPYEPESNILCFRFCKDDATQDPLLDNLQDPLQDKIREKLMRDGSFHLTAATLNGKRYLRMTVMSPQTTDATVIEMLKAIEKVASGG